VLRLRTRWCLRAGRRMLFRYDLSPIGEWNSESENFVKEGPCSTQKILTRKTIPAPPAKHHRHRFLEIHQATDPFQKKARLQKTPPSALSPHSSRHHSSKVTEQARRSFDLRLGQILSPQNNRARHIFTESLVAPIQPRNSNSN
jgi:hypothetical protein